MTYTILSALRAIQTAQRSTFLCCLGVVADMPSIRRLCDSPARVPPEALIVGSLGKGKSNTAAEKNESLEHDAVGRVPCRLRDNVDVSAPCKKRKKRRGKCRLQTKDRKTY